MAPRETDNCEEKHKNPFGLRGEPVTASEQATDLSAGYVFQGLRWLWLAAAMAAVALFLLGVGPLYTAVSGLTVPPTTDPVYPGYLTGAYEIIQTLGVTPAAYAAFEVLLLGAVFGLYIVVAGLIFWRRSHERSALMASYFLLVVGTMTGLVMIAYGLSRFDLSWSHTFSDLIVPVGWNLFVAFLFVFPDGHFAPGWTRWVLLAWLIPWFVPEFMLRVTIVNIVTTAVSLGTLIVAMGAQVHRYRRVSTHIQRQQTKWVILGLLLFVGISLLTYPFNQDLQIWSLDETTLLLAIVPVTIGIAILRAGLWDVDVIIRRTLIYSVLTALLALGFVGSVLLLQAGFSALSHEQSSASIVISTLAIAALFSPLRRSVQAVIDRRFYRRKYDAEQALAEFAATARDETDLDALATQLFRLVQETVQPTLVSLWLRERPNRRNNAVDQQMIDG